MAHVTVGKTGPDSALRTEYLRPTAIGHPVMDAFDPAGLPVAAGLDPALGAGAHPL